MGHSLPTLPPRPGWRRSLWWLPLLALVLVGCSHNPTASEEAEGHYQLTSIDGQSLPYLIPRDPPYADERIIRGSRVELDGSKVTVVWVRDFLDFGGVVIPGQQHQTSHTDYIRFGPGTAIKVTTGEWFLCDACPGLATGTLSNGMLTIVGSDEYRNSSWFWPHVLVYQR